MAMFQRNTVADAVKQSGIVMKILGVLVLGSVAWSMAPFAVVPAGNIGVMTTFGDARDALYEPGLHFRWPVAQTMNLMNVQIQKGDGAGEAASRDLQLALRRIENERMAIAKWDGKLSQVSGGATPFVNVGNALAK